MVGTTPDVLAGSRWESVGRRRVTQKEVGEALGVHHTTVSLALRNHPSLPEETRRKIRAAAAAMGYVADPQLRGLVSLRRSGQAPHRREHLAWLTGSRPLTAERSREQTLQWAGAKALLETLGMGLETWTVGQWQAERLPRGGLVVAETLTEEEGRWLAGRGLCLVALGQGPRGQGWHRVEVDVERNRRLALGKATERGYRRPALVDTSGAPGFGWATPWGECPVFAAEGAEAFGPWLERWRPDVIIGPGSWLLEQLSRRGRRVPEDIAFIDERLQPESGGWAGVVADWQQLGQVAGQALVRALTLHQAGKGGNATTVVGGRWQNGWSLAGHALPAAATG